MNAIDCPRTGRAAACAVGLAIAAIVLIVALSGPFSTAYADDALKAAGLPAEAPSETIVSVADSSSDANAGATARAGQSYIVRVGKARVKMAVHGRRVLSVRKLAGIPAITWTSSRPKVVRAYPNGRIEAKKLGIAVVTATAQNGNAVSWMVRVKSMSKRVKQGKSVKCAALAKSVKGYTFKKAKWKSSKKKVARLKGKKIKTLKRGRTKVTFRAAKRVYTVKLIVRCKHKFKIDKAYSRYCKRQAAELNRKVQNLESKAESIRTKMAYADGYSYRAYMDEYINYISQANQVLNEWEKWRDWSQRTWRKCKHCGFRK